jgi:chromosome partitioning protein
VATPIVSRKAFGKAAAQGRAVTELQPADPKATREITALYDVLFGEREA